MKKKTVLASIFKMFFVTLLFLSFTYIYGQSPDLTPTHWLNRYSDYLRITPEQSNRILSLQENFLKETASTQDELNSCYMALQTMLCHPKADNTGIIAKQDELIAIQQELQEKALKYGLEARAIFSPEQIALLPPGCTMGFIFGRGYGIG